MLKKIKTTDIIAMKNHQKIVMITAYDALFAKLFDEEVEIILVGDSLNMSFNGMSDTLSLSLDATIYHSKAVKNGINHALVVADIPFGYIFDEKSALESCSKVIKESGADAVKIEGGKEFASIIKALCSVGIAVMGHIGLKPQLVRRDGGYKIARDLNSIIEDAIALERAGVFAIVLEATLSDIAKEVASRVDVPVIGIGSGTNVDGQVLVWSDMLGFCEDFKPKFVKRYLDGAQLVKDAVNLYAKEVREGTFPDEEFQYK
ncbi:3-methyl-2-oxobutanoate hydroxymethyltransferase [uncultured Campylobacter sp.]|uniref:3-methyl-2-oxobutanoate hydroxymethyltransferase n=1 Tax=uncultured Campylobacter sp. TaxID=218934 RepID=UPI002626F069|nr:3-methyl-2-oxobutanoate hydroxymethyltransferase [uncultured Campylobacter sp.]